MKLESVLRIAWLTFFPQESNKDIIRRLQAYGVQLALTQDQLEGQTDKLKGKTFVVSGVFQNISRNELKKAIEDNGGKLSSSISSKTSFVVAGENMGPSKKVKAEKLGVPLISEQEFLGMI